MKETVLAKRYANALFELASEADAREKIAGDLALISEIAAENPAWCRILDDDKIAPKKKAGLIGQICAAGGLHDYTSNLLKILASKRNLYIVEDINENYQAKESDKSGAVEAKVTLRDEQAWNKLEKEIASTIKNMCGKKVALQKKLDPSIIGGIIIQIGDSVFDGSIKEELRRFKNNLILKDAELEEAGHAQGG